MHARDAHEAMDLAQPLLERGATVALKILSPDIPHKSEVDGVRLNLSTLPAVQSAANAILSRARQLRPDAHRWPAGAADHRAPEGARADRRHRR
jgi:acetyltransferase